MYFLYILLKFIFKAYTFLFCSCILLVKLLLQFSHFFIYINNSLLFHFLIVLFKKLYIFPFLFSSVLKFKLSNLSLLLFILFSISFIESLKALIFYTFKLFISSIFFSSFNFNSLLLLPKDLISFSLLVVLFFIYIIYFLILFNFSKTAPVFLI